MAEQQSQLFRRTPGACSRRDLDIPPLLESAMKLGLAFSGGGFRATLYHLGLVRFLRDAGILSQVTHITSVSGGSNMAAHLVLNWKQNTGSTEEFEQAAARLL